MNKLYIICIIILIISGSYLISSLQSKLDNTNSDLIITQKALQETVEKLASYEEYKGKPLDLGQIKK